MALGGGQSQAGNRGASRSGPISQAAVPMMTTTASGDDRDSHVFSWAVAARVFSSWFLTDLVSFFFPLFSDHLLARCFLGVDFVSVCSAFNR